LNFYAPNVVIIESKPKLFKEDKKTVAGANILFKYEARETSMS